MSYTLKLLDIAPHNAILQRILDINPSYKSQGIAYDRAYLLQLVVNANGLNPQDLKYVILPNFYDWYILPDEELLRRTGNKPNMTRSELIKRLTNPTKNILVVGAGPVGLLFAIMMHENPLLRDLYTVTLLEKRSQYTRDVILLLNADTYNLLPSAVKNEIWGSQQKKGCYVLPPSKDELARCYLDKLPLASVPTNILESSLLRYAQSIGIPVIRPTTGSLNIIITPNSISVNGQPLQFDIVVGADGYNSQIRSNMLESGVSSKVKPIYGFTITDRITVDDMDGVYKHATPSRIKTVAANLPQNAFRFFRTPYGLIYLGLLLNEREYQEIVSSKQYPPWLIERINNVCRIVKVKKCIFPTPENSSIFKVDPIFSNIFSRTDPFPVYLIGDSLANTNFFTGSGVNIGVAMAKSLTNLLYQYNNGAIPVDIYRKTQQANVKQLINNAAAVVQQQVTLDEI